MQLRMTNQREMILKEIRRSGDHPTADELYERVRKKMPRISLATVYRNLEILAEAGLIGKLEVSGRQKRFDWDSGEHDHIHCIRCHRVDNLHVDRDELEIIPSEGVGGYRITGYRLEFSGLCDRCQQEQQQEEED